MVVQIHSHLPPSQYAIYSCQGRSGGLHLLDGPSPLLWSHLHNSRLHADFTMGNIQYGGDVSNPKAVPVYNVSFYYPT